MLLHLSHYLFSISLNIFCGSRSRGTPSCPAPNFHCGRQLLRTETDGNSTSLAKIGKKKSYWIELARIVIVIQQRTETSKSECLNVNNMRDRDVRIKREENTFGFNQEDVGAENCPVGIDPFHEGQAPFLARQVKRQHIYNMVYQCLSCVIVKSKTLFCVWRWGPSQIAVLCASFFSRVTGPQFWGKFLWVMWVMDSDGWATCQLDLLQ